MVMEFVQSGLLPAPFEWIQIPAGRVTLVPDDSDIKQSYLESNMVFDLPAFVIAKYPITNAQFAKFIDVGGYKNQKWWTVAGWQQKEEENWTEPHFWRDNQWNGTEHPVVGVSWYEALAFCMWLREISGEQILLPTEQQWQRAAQGDDDRIYPWGNDWDGNRCNNNVGKKGIGKTTPVTHYKGTSDSPFGTVDMAGNVWEWCLTDYNTGSQDPAGINNRVMRGGSWDDGDPESFQIAARGWPYPHLRYNLSGFRCACLS